MIDSLKPVFERSAPLSRGYVFDRTPIFLGVVLLPLAASCFLGNAGFANARFQAAADSHPLSRIILFYALERERRAEALLPATVEEADSEKKNENLHPSLGLLGKAFSGKNFATKRFVFHRLASPGLLTPPGRPYAVRGPPAFPIV